MAEACEIQGVAFQNGSAVLLARVVGANGELLTPVLIQSAQYTITLLDDNDLSAATPITGHTAVPLNVSSLLRATPVVDDAWDLDTVGYNFRHEINVTSAAAFALAGRHYRVQYALTPSEGQVILVRFRVHVV